MLSQRANLPAATFTAHTIINLLARVAVELLLVFTTNLCLPSHCKHPLQVTIRLGGYARRFAPVRLAASKSIALAIIAVGWLSSIAVLDMTGGKSTDYWSGWNNPAVLLAVVWSALGPGALVAFLQSQVMHHIKTSWPPAEAGQSCGLKQDLCLNELMALLSKVEGMSNAGPDIDNLPAWELKGCMMRHMLQS